VLFAGVRVVRAGHPVGGLRDDLLRRGERRVLPAVRLTDEVRGAVAADGAGRRRARRPHRRPAQVAAEPRGAARLLRHFGPVGRRGRRLANAS